MRHPSRGSDEVRRLDNPVQVPGGCVGTDPFRRWGPALRWTSIAIQAPIRGVNWRPFDKRDVVVTARDGGNELYREGPFTSTGAARRQREIVREITVDGLPAFLR